MMNQLMIIPVQAMMVDRVQKCPEKKMRNCTCFCHNSEQQQSEKKHPKKTIATIDCVAISFLFSPFQLLAL